MKKNNLPRIIVIVGPTASGKSDLALRLAKLAQGKLFKKHGIMGAEIISADSRQVYRGMDIGTGKVTKKEQKLVKHHLLDVVSPKKQFTADDFKKLGEKTIKDILAKKKVPIIVGGTGFYIDILIGRMTVAQVPPNKKLRAKLEKQSAEQLFKQLLVLDPQRAEVIDRHNRRRLIRALEIIITTKSSSLATALPTTALLRYEILWLGINPGKEKLARNIKKRLDSRLKQGMIEEVERLHKQGVSWKRLDDFGLEYRQISRYLQNHKSQITNYKQIPNSKSQIPNFKNSEYYEELLREIIRYSKRQMTWFKRNKEIHWFTLSNIEGLNNTKTRPTEQSFGRATERLARRFIN